MQPKKAGPNKELQAGRDSTEYLRQIGKRIQTYWGTAHPKKFIRTFSEIDQLLKIADGLCVRIIDEGALHRVQLTIEPYTEDQLRGNKYLLKPFYIPSDTLEGFKQCYENPINADTLSVNRALGIEFCIGKETPDQELYDYYIILRVVDLCHNALIKLDYLPFTAPEIERNQG